MQLLPMTFSSRDFKLKVFKRKKEVILLYPNRTKMLRTICKIPDWCQHKGIMSGGI